MNISEFREQFPQYNELSDSDLADRIYQKYYAGKLPHEAFVGRFVAPAYPEAQKTEPPGLADKALRTLKGAGQAVKGYYDYLHTPTEPAEGVQDFMGRVIPESVAKTTVGLVEFPYHLVKSVTDPLVKAVFNADEKGVKEVVKGLGKEEAQALWQNLEGLARFAGEPIGVYGLETMKKRWLTDPAGAIVGILPLVKAGAAKVSELKGRTAPEAAEPSPTVGEKHYRVDNADEPLRDHYTFAGPQAKETAFNVAEKLATAEGKPQKVYEIPAEHIKEKGGEPVGEWAEGAEVWKTKEKMDAKELKKVGDEPINPMSEERIRAVNRLRSLKTHPKQAEYIADELGVPVEHVIDAVDAIDKNGMPTNELERILVNKAYSDQLNRYKKTVPRETPIKAQEVTETPGESPTVGKTPEKGNRIKKKPKRGVAKKKPEPDIIDFAIKKGGLNLEREYLKAELRDLRGFINNGKSFGKGHRLVRGKAGKYTLDELREAAVEKGYLPEESDINDILDALYERRKHPLYADDLDYAAMEREAAKKRGLPPDTYKPQIAVEPHELLQMPDGTKIIIRGEEYIKKGMDNEGQIVLKDGETIKVDAFDKPIIADEVRHPKEHTTVLTAPEPETPKQGEVTLEAGMADLEKIRNIPSYFRETLKIPDPETRTYKVTNKAIENWRVTEHEAALDAIKLQDDIWKALPDRQAREQIAYALEEPEFANSLTPQQREVYERARAFYRNYEEVLKEEGILDTFVEDYVNHIIKSTPKEARKANLGTGGNLGHKPAFTHRRVRGEGEKFFTIRELEEMGYEVEKDIANLMALYDYTAKRAIINKNLVEQIKKIKTKDGGKALRPWSKVPYEERGNYLTIDDGQLKKWSGHKFDEGIKLFQTPTALHKDAWYTVDNILKSTRPSSQLYKWFAKGRSGVKRLIMFNPLIHGFNVESNVIMALGRDYPKRFTRRTPEEVEALRREMVQNGVELEGLFDVRRKLEQDIYIPKLTERGKWDLKRSNFRNIMNHPIQAIRHWGDAILWDKWVKSGQVVVYEVLKKRFLKKMSEADAGHAAAMVTNDLLGTLPSTWFTKNQRRFLFNTMFARNWTVSNLRTLTGMLGKRAKSGWLPKPLRFENVTDAQLKEMSKEYRKIILKGVVGSIATANAVQAMFLKANGMPIHPIWKNEEEHRMDIDTGMIDTKGRKIYLKNWLFRQIDDYAKLFEGHPIQFAKAKAEPIMRTIAEIVLNVDYFGKPIVKRGMEWKRSLKEIGKYVVKGITPLDNFVGRENEVRTWAEALIPLTGTWIRHGIATGSADNRFANILRGYYEYRAKKFIMTDDLKARVKKLIQQGKDSEAWRLVDGVNLTPEQYINIQKSLKMPFWYRVGGRKKLKSDFVEYLMTLPEDERAEFWNAVQDATIDRSLNKKKRR